MVGYPTLTLGQQTTGTISSGQNVVNYYFPVEIVIVGGLPEEEHQAIQARLWEKFGDALDRIA